VLSAGDRQGKIGKTDNTPGWIFTGFIFKLRIGMRDFLERKCERVTYYTRHFFADALPYKIYEKRLAQLYLQLKNEGLEDTVIDRVSFYNKLPRSTLLQQRGILAKDIPLEATYYYYDLKEHLNYFQRDIQLHYKFGDLNHLLDKPSFCKARPICSNNSNSVLCKLDKFRHFRWAVDELSFGEKRKACVWRGGLHNDARRLLVEKYHQDRRHNIGHVGPGIGSLKAKEWLSSQDQFAYRYIVSIEGYDVATNLKSVLASQSVCFMRKPKIESWFMESRLQPGIHYVELRDDFSDLAEKVDYYDQHEEEALSIVRAANNHVRQFTNLRTEKIISILVMQKYFESIGQLEHSQFTQMFWPYSAAKELQLPTTSHP